MVDPLRQDIKKLMSEVPQILIENEEMLEILDGRVDDVIQKHKEENLVVASINSDEPINSGEVILSPREDMEEDGEIDDESQITEEMAKQLIYQFGLNYDEQTVKDLEQARNSKLSKKTSRRLKEYDEAKELIEKLKERFNIK